MQRKPGYPVANCNIKMPDSVPLAEGVPCDDDGDQQQRRQQLINFGHSQWGFSNWSWSVNKQDLDFVDFSNGMYCAGVVAFVAVSVKTLDIRRENIGYATCTASFKGSAIYQARKCAVTNALRETLLSFGGAVAAALLQQLEAARPEAAPEVAPAPAPENNQDVANRPAEPAAANTARKEAVDIAANPVNIRHPLAPPAIKNVVPKPNPAPPVAKALPMPVKLPMAARPRAPGRGSPNEPRDTEEARAERKRRQRQAQEEFRLKQLQKNQIPDQELTKGSSIDSLLMAIPTQDIVPEEGGKRRSPSPEGSAKRHAGSKMDAVDK